eukprot:TRINITY_DN8298_c0_g1_i2.p1 TRINITY_DN8298_c0_g1~~TRINITY_DN8298_c0_g1_i2.p1  ORF type:complete len:593 (-),score=67.33 TRINITY_DN8298_c0_g1_i2:36-1592(-)
MVHAILRPHSFSFTTSSSTIEMHLSNVIGFTVDNHEPTSGKGKEKDATLSFVIHMCMLKNAKKNVREIAKFKFTCPDASHLERWQVALHNTLNPPGKPNNPSGRRITVIINPFSGTKTAPKVFAEVRPLFEIAGVLLNVVETSHAGHAREIGLSLDPNTCDGVVSVSGDGLLNELVNGLLERPDWKLSCKIPIGIIPGGSGNGLAWSLRVSNPISAALAIIKGHSRPMDAAMVIQHERRVWSFLTLTWTIISDVDLESEKYRWMGEPRFTVAAIKRIMSLRKYRGKIAFLPAHGDHEFEPSTSIPEAGPSSGSKPVKKGHVKCASFTDCEHCLGTPDHKIRSEQDTIPVTYASAEASVASLSQHSLHSVISENMDSLSPSSPTFLTNVPPDWTVLEGDFVLFVATNVTLISSDFMASPYAHLSDGAYDVMIIRDQPNLSRMKLLSMFMDTESGKFVHNPLVEFHKVRALALQPGPLVDGHKLKDRTEGGAMAIDGERMPYSPVVLEVFQGILNMMCFD